MNMSSRSKTVAGSIAALGTAAGVFGMALPASAATADFSGVGKEPAKNADGQCLVTPSWLGTITHLPVTHKEKRVTPGTDAVTHDESRWSRQTPGTDAVTHVEGQYFRDIPGTDAVTHDQWMYMMDIPGLEEVWHFMYQFSRTNPGQAEVSHQLQRLTRTNPGKEAVTHEERQFSRTNPGVEEQSHQEYRFSRTNPGQEQKSHSLQQLERTIPGQTEKSHQEFKYEKQETQYQYRTRVKRPDNTVERKFIKGYDFVSGGSVKINGHTIPGHWVKSSGWHQIPDVVINAYWGSGGVPSSYLGGSEARPKGNVSLTAYAGPNVSVPYYASLESAPGGYTDWSGWSDWTTTNPGADSDTRDVQSRTVTIAYNNGDWTTDAKPNGYTQVDARKVIDRQATPSRTEYLAQDESVTTDESQAGWFPLGDRSGWTQHGTTKEVVDQEYVAPFTEYRAQDGSATTDEAQAAWFSATSFTGWGRFGDSKTVVDRAGVAPFEEYLAQDGSASLNPADAGWFSDTTKDGWLQFGQAKTVTDEATIAPFSEYLAQDESVTTESDEAGWFPLQVHADWQRFGDVETIVTQVEIQPFTEYRAQDGSATTDPTEAGSFPESSFDGWEQFGEPTKVIDQQATEDQLVYLTRDDQGILGQSSDEAGAAIFTSTNGVDTDIWQEFGRETITDQEAVPARRVYKTADGVSEDPANAAWLPLTPVIDDDPWKRVVDEGGNALVRTVTDVEAVPGSTEYYVQDAEPSATLGQANWTQDTPEGWSLVDTRTITDAEPTPPTTTFVVVTDERGWVEGTIVPAVYKDCPAPTLATTGGRDAWGLAGLGTLVLALGGAAIAVPALRRHRRLKDELSS